MSWKQRLLELTLAGGLVASAAGCDDNVTHDGGWNGIPMCNADPDPCCFDPYSQACYDEHSDMSVPSDLARPRDLTPSSD